MQPLAPSGYHGYIRNLGQFSGSSQTPGSSVLFELQLSNRILGKVGDETITIVHPAGDNKGMNNFSKS